MSLSSITLRVAAGLIAAGSTVCIRQSKNKISGSPAANRENKSLPADTTKVVGKDSNT
jgi:hypothetical protein